MRKFSAVKEKKYSYLIETDELYNLIKNKKEYLLFDTSWYNIKVHKSENLFNGGDQEEKIEGSINFDSVVTSNENSIFSFFFPTQSEFFTYLKELLTRNETNIRKTSLENIPIIFYEKDDIFYAPRIWFMFKIYGFKNVKILNGGLNKWLNEEKDTITSVEKESNIHIIDKEKSKNVDKIIEEHLNKNEDEINNNLKTSIYYYLDIEKLIISKEKLQITNYLLVDTRPNKFFSALLSINEKEKKINNHIPFSINIPYHYFLNQHYETYKYVTFKNELEIKNILDKYGLLNEENVVILTCNKGISACVLLYLLHLLNKPLSKLIFNQGSFVEYAHYKYNIR
ncbi:rhodanese like protein, putative [Plasmodium malariae]|nr:rhodanese like protein, putative [Plasmodium malariae]SCP02517.1 rhodanese like protein, putative [Plasmodium malariae]